jgi:polar amino acid transport system substrate-binding protein
VVLALVIAYKANLYRRQAQEDALTGIYNRGSIESILKKLLRKEDGSILFFDIDHFKKINDTYGHEKGDFVLKKLAKIIKDHIRESDIFGRWGGEEFVLILPNTPYEKALIVAEKIRKIVESSDFDGIDVTISVGVSEFRKGDSVKSVVKKADLAMYKAKEDGRNRVKGIK